MLNLSLVFTCALSPAVPCGIPLGMQDLSAKLEKLRTEAEDCELIANMATDINKRTLFARLAFDLRRMARDVEAMIAARATDAK
jgi:hypothetical protein